MWCATRSCSSRAIAVRSADADRGFRCGPAQFRIGDALPVGGGKPTLAPQVQAEQERQADGGHDRDGVGGAPERRVVVQPVAEHQCRRPARGHRGDDSVPVAPRRHVGDRHARRGTEPGPTAPTPRRRTSAPPVPTAPATSRTGHRRPSGEDDGRGDTPAPSRRATRGTRPGNVLAANITGTNSSGASRIAHRTRCRARRHRGARSSDVHRGIDVDRSDRRPAPAASPSARARLRGCPWRSSPRARHGSRRRWRRWRCRRRCAAGPRTLAPAPMVTRLPIVGWRLTCCMRPSAERDPVVDHHVVADLGGFADHHAHAVVDEEPAPDGRAGMDLDAGEEARELRQHPGGPAQRRLRPQPVGQPVGPDGVQTRVDERVLDVSARGRVVRRARSARSSRRRRQQTSSGRSVPDVVEQQRSRCSARRSRRRPRRSACRRSPGAWRVRAPPRRSRRRRCRRGCPPRCRARARPGWRRRA